MKKVIALLLSLILLFGCGTFAVSADSSDEIKDGYRYGEVLVQLNNQSASVANILTGFEIENVRLLTPGSSDAVYQIVFAEKTKDIVWRAIDVLNQSEDVKIAEPNYIGQYLPVDDSENENSDYTRKMDPALIEKLNDPDVDQVDVCIFLKNAIHSDAQVEQIISERYTWTTQQEHLMCWRKVVSEIIGAYVQQFLDDNGDLLDEVLWHCDAVEMIEASVSKENVYRLAELDTVSSIDLYVESYPEPDIDPEPTIEEMIVDAANELYHPQNPFPAEDIMMEFSYRFKDSSAYAVRFIVKDVEYISIELVEHIGDWLLYSGYYPEPYIFANNKLYTVREAYEGKIISQAQMQELSESTKALHSEFCLTRYIKGDADGDGECNVIDATVIQRYDATIIGEYDLYKPLADVDGDSDVSVIDATLIQRYDVGLFEIE